MTSKSFLVGLLTSTAVLAASAAMAQSTVPLDVTLKTKSSIDIGGQISDYHYHEPTADVKIRGPQFGLIAAVTSAFGDHWFGRLDTRLAGGTVTYKGSGESDDPNMIAEVRAEVGRDFLQGRFAFSPYLGLGYRHVRHDFRGLTSTGASGYLRLSHYLFAPVGLESRMALGGGDVISLTTEIDPLLQGWQKSELSGAVAGYPDITNSQRFGYGIRANMMYDRGRWAVGPFLNYWDINRATTDCKSTAVTRQCAYEPTNHTMEYGLQFRYSFY